MKRVLVIGGAGYLGSVLCRKLLGRGYVVRILDSLLYTDIGIKDFYDDPNFEFMKGDVRNVQDIINSMKNVDTVIHLAAIVGDSACSLNPEDTIDVNYLSTKIILWVCKYYKIKRYIFASTCSVYGGSEDRLLTEEDKTKPLSLYAEMKLKAENTILREKDKDFHPCIIRMATLYGNSPRMRFDLVVNFFTANATKNHLVSLFGGNQKRCFCDVEDAAMAYVECIEAPISKIDGEIFNVSSENLMIKDLATLIADEIPNTKIKTYKKNVDSRSYITTSEKIEHTIGWKAKKSIRQFVNKFDENEWNDFEDNLYNNYQYLRE